MPDDEDKLLTAGFAMYANPGAYALLLGAGVSAPSGIPTAWDVLTDLAEQLARVRGSEDISDPVGWYSETFGEAATYQGILERLAPRPIERQRLLQAFFEIPPSSDSSAPAPTAAHRAIARLVRDGYVRVIITLNFDRLMERALIEESIEPTIVATPSDATGMAPLHTLRCVVLHLHGDYLTPTSMLNTFDELGSYSDEMERLLESILENYGLLVAGWSSLYDPALRQAIAAHYPSRYTMTWFEPWNVTQEARDLQTLKKASVLKVDANTGFGKLSDTVAALERKAARHPLTVPVAVETAKREIQGASVAIGLHDTLRLEYARLQTLPELYPPLNSSIIFGDLVGRIHEASRVAAALTATISYWGNKTTDQWWIDELTRFALPTAGDGLVRLLTLRQIQGAALFYAAGVAAVDSGRLSLVVRLFQKRHRASFRDGYTTLSRTLNALAGMEDSTEAPTRLWLMLRPILLNVLASGEEGLDEAWQRFEIMRLAFNVSQLPNFDTYEAGLRHADGEIRRTEHAIRAAERASLPRDALEAQLRLDEGARKTLIDDVARRINSRWLRILSVDEQADERYTSPVVNRFLNDLATDGNASGIVASGLFADQFSAQAALQFVNASISNVGSNIAWARVSERAGTVPSQVWLDTGQTPEERTHSSAEE